MLILYICCVFVPIIFTNVIFYYVTTNNVKNQRTKDITRAIEQIKNEFRAKIEDAVTVSTAFYTDLNLNDMLEAEYVEPADYVGAYDSYFRKIINNYTPMYNAVQNIKIYVDNPTLLHSGGIGDLTDKVKQSVWYQQLENSKSSQPIFVRTEREDLFSVKDAEPVRDSFSIIRRMDYYSSQNHWNKILKIEMKTTSIQQIFQNLNLQGHIYLINAEDQIEYTTDPKVDWRKDSASFSSLKFPPGMLEFETTYQYVNYMEGWRIVGTIPEEEVLKEVRNSREFIFLLACINIILPTLIILWITRSMNVRLVRILKHMKKVKNQHFDIINQREHTDEIGQLTSEFNRMTIQVKSLIDDVYVADIQTKSLELERRKAQLNALQSQINPHFLFNALETIRMRSLIKDEMETAKIIHNMAKIFRMSLTWGKDRVKVMEEIEFVLCFLEIQKYRFEDRLDYHIHIDPSAKECVVPKMMFLPFVENASIHGIEPLRNGGRIEVRIERQAAALVFSIRDNGVGMDEDKVNQFYSYLESEEVIGERIGVQNVIYRMKLIYGSRFRFLIESAPGQGTYICLSVPVD
ncbi:sensor histidine kinase [Paenibacillus sepulcri]|uniref:Sensor histidine kinase n=1 Tax=Paenibacillus sepulcri TaxID=359917 RepID=A0ABS7C1B4_9BACL|nr:sensor histidine kinase [Paenibacillus sepulcri]